jgi:hypothetical protein
MWRLPRVFISGFNTPDDAVSFADRLRKALTITAIEFHTAFTVNGKPRIEEKRDNPDVVGREMGLNRPIDVIIDTSFPAVYPSDARIGRVTANKIGVINRLPFERFEQSFSDGLTLSAFFKIVVSFFCSSRFGIFLTGSLRIQCNGIHRCPVPRLS